MNPAIPPALATSTAALLEGVSRKDLAARAATLSRHYRACGDSSATITDEMSALAYLVSRLPATFAVTVAAFDAAREALPQFQPKTMLDVGAGPGTASWAAIEIWPCLQHLTMADSNSTFLALAKTLAQSAENSVLQSARFIAGTAFATNLHLPKSDMVVASYFLAEIEEARRTAVIEQIWSAADGVLILIEPGTPAGFARIRSAREWLVSQGAHVVAPCTHDNACPIAGSNWCHFSQRLPRSRDHMKLKSATVPFEDERYSYLAASRSIGGRVGVARIIAQPEETKAGFTLPLCTENGLHRAFVSRRQRELFNALRKAKWGDTILSQD